MAKKEKEYLYDWCIRNNRQDLLESLEKAGVDFELIKTKITYGSKEKLSWFCPKCKEKYDKLIKDNPKLPKFYIHECEAQKKTLGNGGYKYGCPICSDRGKKPISGVNDFETFCKLNKDKYGYLLNEWDYEKNIIKPNEIFPNRTKNDIHWKCKNGHQWTASPNSRINTGNGCRKCSSERRKSKAEKTVYYYIKQVFPNVIESYKIPKTRGLEIDIYIKELSLGIEYDGFWHNRNIQRDIRKYKICKDSHIRLIRIREKQCEKTDNIADVCYYLKQENNKDLDNAIRFLFNYIKTLTNKTFKIPDINWKRDIHKAEEYIDLQIKENSVGKYQLLNDQWHPTKNGSITPDRVSAQSNIPRYWRCLDCGYGLNKDEDWLVSPNARIEKGKVNGCPSCAGQELHKGYNDFETRCNNKEYQKEYKKKYNKDLKLLLEEWNETENSKIITKNGKSLTKDNILFGSGNKVAWVCSKCGYGKNGEWKTPLKARTLSGRGCPVCSGNIVVKGYNDIATTHPEIAEQWDEERNLEEFGRTKYNTSKGFSKHAVYWLCDKGHPSYKTIPNDKTVRNSCPICNNWQLYTGFNDLETYCKNKENQIKYKIKHEKFNKELLSMLDEWHKDNEISPKDIRYSDNKELVLWKCPICGGGYRLTVKRKLNREGIGCNNCVQKQKNINLRIKKTKGKELSKLNPKLAKEWHPDPNKNYSEKYGFILTPDNTSANSKDKVWWKCSVCGHEWPAQVYSRYKGSGCPKCNK